MAHIPKEQYYEAFRDAIRRRVCSVCLDQRDDGSCGLSGRTCAIESHLPGLVAALAGIESSRMDEYVAAIEAQVCGNCAVPDAARICQLRQRGDCALYTYLPLVVEAVKEVQERQGPPPEPAA